HTGFDQRSPDPALGGQDLVDELGARHSLRLPPCFLRQRRQSLDPGADGHVPTQSLSDSAPGGALRGWGKMGRAIGDVLPVAVAIAVFPVPIIAVVLFLGSGG